jgi:hypothetical protein
MVENKFSKNLERMARSLKIVNKYDKIKENVSGG